MFMFMFMFIMFMLWHVHALRYYSPFQRKYPLCQTPLTDKRSHP